MEGLELKNIQKSYGDVQALSAVSCKVNRGEVVALLGPSGCGKSTALAVIAGLEPPDQGQIFWDGTPVDDIPPHRRGFGLMFQDYALFPHLNVFDNVAFGLKMFRLPKTEIQSQVRQALQLVGLPDFVSRDISTLSGGEQQRVAFARSIVPHPRLLMLDEPLGSLDRNLRERLLIELRGILKSMQQTALYVTHDQEEAFSVADRIVLMNTGRVEQIGRPTQIYQQPASIFAARFLGLTNLIRAEIVNRQGKYFAQTAIGLLPVKSTTTGSATILLRPDSVSLDGRGSYQLDGIVNSRSFHGSTCTIVIDVNNMHLTFDTLSSTDLPKAGESVSLGFEPERAIQVFKD